MGSCKGKKKGSPPSFIPAAEGRLESPTFSNQLVTRLATVYTAYGHPVRRMVVIPLPEAKHEPASKTPPPNGIRERMSRAEWLKAIASEGWSKIKPRIREQIIDQGNPHASLIQMLTSEPQYRQNYIEYLIMHRWLPSRLLLKNLPDDIADEIEDTVCEALERRSQQRSEYSAYEVETEALEYA